MKYLIPLFVLISLTSFSQDKIVTLQNDTVDCKIVKGTNQFFNIERNGANSKLRYEDVKAYYMDGRWWEITENQFNDTPASESIMKRRPENMYALKEGNSGNPFSSSGLLLEKGGNQIVAGTLVGLISAALGIALASETPTAAAFIGGGGFIAGTIITISGASKISRAGHELQRARYE
jgi:hypothetical protein